jgi:hypothetical protein
MTIQGDKVTAHRTRDPEKTSTIKLDTISSPKRIELVNEAGTMMRALYMIEGNVLVITFQDGNNPFPTSMAVTDDLQGAMMVLQKVPFNSSQNPARESTAREALLRAETAAKMRQIGLAFHVFADNHAKFPRDITDDNGKPLLSWRVALLPFLEQNNLYKQFHLDEPWDSEHNKKLMLGMPKIFALEDANQRNSTTYFQSFSGKGTAFEPNTDLHFRDIVDGTSNTIMFVEAANAVPWTKPADVDFVPQKPLPKLGGHLGKQFQVMMLDGSLRTLSQSIKEATLKALITRAGGEIPALDEAKTGPGGRPSGR